MAVKNPQAHKQAQERYARNQNKRGLIRVQVWVPEEFRDALLKYVNRLRTRYEVQKN